MPRFLHTADWQIGRQYSHFFADDALPLADEAFDVQTESDRTYNMLFNSVANLVASRLLPTAEEIVALTVDGCLRGVFTERRNRHGGQPPGVDAGMTWEVEAP